MLFSVHSVQVHCCCNELFVVYGTISISIRLKYSKRRNMRESYANATITKFLLPFLGKGEGGNLFLTASINCLTSYSDSFVPCFASPCLSSSSVIVPLLSVSMPLNICFSPMISSSERHPAITYYSIHGEIRWLERVV